MKFAFYYRVSPGANETKIGRGEAENLDAARSLAENAVKAKFPGGVLLNVCDAANEVAPVDLSRVYAFYYRDAPRTSPGLVGRVVADNRDEAKKLASEAVAKTYPDGSVAIVVLAKNSPYPTKNAHGASCPPSMVY